MKREDFFEKPLREYLPGHFREWLSDAIVPMLLLSAATMWFIALFNWDDKATFWMFMWASMTFVTVQTFITSLRWRRLAKQASDNTATALGLVDQGLELMKKMDEHIGVVTRERDELRSFIAKATDSRKEDMN